MNSMTGVARAAPMMIPANTQGSGDEVVPCDIRFTDAEGPGLCSVLYNKDIIGPVSKLNNIVGVDMYWVCVFTITITCTVCVSLSIPFPHTVDTIVTVETITAGSGVGTAFC